MNTLTQLALLQNIRNIINTLQSSNTPALTCTQLIVIERCMLNALEHAPKAFQYIDTDVLGGILERLQLTKSACMDAVIKPVIIMPQESISATLNCVKLLLDACIASNTIDNEI